MLCPACGTDIGLSDQCPSCQLKDESVVSNSYLITTDAEADQALEPDHLSLEDISTQEGLAVEESEPEASVTIREETVEVLDLDEAASEDSEPIELDGDTAESSVSDSTEAGRSISITESVDRSTIMTGDIERLYLLNGVALGEGKPEEEKSLIEFTHGLPGKDPLLPNFVLDELEEYLARLREERIILVSCPCEEIALGAVYEFLDRLDIPLEHRRMLNFETRSEEGSEISVYSTLTKRKDSGIEMALVIDALSDKSQMFIDSLFKSRISSSALTEDLKHNGIWLLCNVDPAYIARKPQIEKGGLKFPLWKIPFLRPILDLHYLSQASALEADILRQRSAGKWSKDEVEFYDQVAEEIKRGNLPGEIQSLDEREPTPPESLFKDKDPTGNVLLYVATHFPNLNHKMFDEVVMCLLRNIGGIPAATTHKALDYSRSADLTPIETWQEQADEKRREYSLETISLKDSVRVISFSDHRLREALNVYMEKECGFYLERQLRILQQQGLLFYPSAKVAENLIRLIVDKAASQSEEYDLGWLIEIIVKLKQYASLEGSATSISKDPLFQFLERVQINRIGFAYRRISWLIRSMLEYAELKEVVSEFLGRLISPKRYDACFQIIKRLRFAPNLDEFYWIKQLLERGDRETRIQTSRYLYSYVKKIEPNIYETLAVLKTWLPEKERSTSISSCIALRLLLDYCSDSTAQFAAKQRDPWLDRHPLFASKNLSSANSNLELLVILLFHPGMKAALPKRNPNYMVGKLIFTWAYLLCGSQGDAGSKGSGYPDDRGSSSENETPSSASSWVSPPELLDLLLNHVVAITSKQQQEDLLTVWKQNHDVLLNQAADPLCSRGRREELALKRRLAKQVINYVVDFQRRSLFNSRQKAFGIERLR